jgi:DNA recombination protein Rad52
MDWERITPELNRKLDPAAVRPAPKGKFGDYVDGYHVISEANRIFGNGGWSYEITRLSETHRAAVKTDRGDQVRVSFLCTVKVRVGETFKEGSAVGMGSGKPDNLGDVIESAVKEAETDALKRALRTYGNTFGLALYDKSRENVGYDLPPFDAAGCQERLLSRVAKATGRAELEAIWADETEARIALKTADLGLYNSFVKAFKAAGEKVTA